MTDTFSHHPPDDVLFDLIEGRIDDAQAAEIEAHLDACDSCGVLVQLAIDGSPDTVVPVQAMAAASAQRVEQALRLAWNERIRDISARERRDDERASSDEVARPPNAAAAVAAADDLDTGLESASDHTAAARAAATPRRSTKRRWLAVAAVAALAALGGASVLLPDAEQRTSTPTEARDSAATESSSPWEGATSDTAAPMSKDAARSGPAGAATPSASEPATTSTANGVEAASPTNGSSSSDPSIAGSSTAVPADVLERLQRVPHGKLCIAAPDPSRLALPDGRPPTVILTAPLGVYVVCG